MLVQNVYNSGYRCCNGYYIICYITFNYIIYPRIPLCTYIPWDIVLPVYMYLLHLLNGTATVWMKSSVFIHLTQLPSNPILFGFGRLALRCDFSKTKIQPLTLFLTPISILSINIIVPELIH